MCFALIVQSGCTSTTTLSSSAQPNLIIDPLASGEIDVEYSRASVELAKQSFAGFLTDVAPQEDTRVAVLDYQNGNKRGTVNSRGINVVVAFTGASFWLGTSLAFMSIMPEPISDQQVDDRGFLAALLSLPLAIISNESIWSLTNKQRVRSFAQQTLIERESADFYCLPNERMSLKRSLFSTKWNYDGEMLAGTYSIKNGESSVLESQSVPANRDVEESQLSITQSPLESAGGQPQAKGRSPKKAQNENLCYVKFKGEWLEGVIDEVIFLENGARMYQVSFQHSGKEKSRVFGASKFSLNDNALAVGDHVLYRIGSIDTEGVVTELTKTPNGRVAQIQYVRDGKKETVVVPSSMLRRATN